MTPQPHPPTRRVPVRRSAALLAAVLLITGAPLVARALGSDVPAEVAQPERAAVEQDIAIDADPLTTEADTQPAPSAIEGIEGAEGIVGIEPIEVAPPATVDPVIVLLADTYSWNESGARVAALQQNLGVVADGVYGHATQQAHRNAMEFVGLPTDAVPAAPLPPGPSAAEWEALRWCESNGNYAITNPSGKYRGAYQFDRSTWNSVADRHAPHLVGADPAAASPADQDFMARALYSEHGARPWPHCGRHLS